MKKVDITLDEIEAFDNEEFEGIKLKWSGSIGFGEYTLYKSIRNDKWYADSECMDKGNDKEFLKLLLKQIPKMVEVRG